jgi:hypothetical protein
VLFSPILFECYPSERDHQIKNKRIRCISKREKIREEKIEINRFGRFIFYSTVSLGIKEYYDLQKDNNRFKIFTVTLKKENILKNRKIEKNHDSMCGLALADIWYAAIKFF